VSKFSTTQQQQLAEIGAYLQQVRLEQDKSLDEIATRTFIPMRLLKAIEQAQSDALPEAVFVRGFIRRFGEALNLDGTAIALEFTLDDTEPPPQVSPPQAAPVHSPQPAPVQSVEPEPTDELYARRERRSKNTQFPWSTAIVFSLIALIGALLVYGLNRRTAQPELAASPSVESPSAAPAAPSLTAETVTPSPAVSPDVPAVVSPSPSGAAIAPATPTAPATPAAGATPVSVSLNLTDRSWLRVTVDGEVEFEGILAEGAQQSWAAQQAIVIRAGNAGAVVVSPNQGAAQPMGTPGTAVTQTYTPNGLQSQ